ncbi:RNA polymerase sigma factor [Streptomyces sp. CoT10]|uniref:RNA polymerase sigma factor n=1 Tax=Streptomyces sp. CoT10 TaxID=2875762 RepID=UPI001CD4D913|nr:sigma factor [Streptomyces sp. CoT10]
MHGYFARRVPGAADDLLAEAWLQAFAARRTFDASRGSARGWLFGVARNVLAGHVRRTGRDTTAPAPAASDPWQAVDQRLDAPPRWLPRCAKRSPICPPRNGS